MSLSPDKYSRAKGVSVALGLLCASTFSVAAKSKEVTSIKARPSLLFAPPPVVTVEKTVEKIVPPQTKKKKVVTKKRNTFSLKKLPMTFQSWVVDLRDTKQSGRMQCVARNTESMINDGQSASTITVEVESSSLRILTESTIDMSYVDSGVTVDNGFPYTFDSLFFDTNVEVNIGAEDLISQMRKGNSATVTLGFWPTWPVTQSYSAEVSLTGFAKAMSQLKVCEKFLAKS